MRPRNYRQTRLRAALFSVLAIFVLAGSAWSQEDDLTELSLEELLNVEVTSVSKKAEKRTEAAAAIFVLTNEDIRRSGATNIPDALRLVPGVSVARIDATTWAITARGGGGRFANSLLVLVDGRAIYSPLFGGVLWEEHEVMLEDLDRIEVIRGPGGTLWGANAVNGVINIVTKKAQDTQGGLLSAGTGTEEVAFGALRYGGTIGDDVFYRVYGKFHRNDEGGDHADGSDANDRWTAGQIGFRFDWDASDRDTLMLQGAWNTNKQDVTSDLPTLQAPRTRRVRSVTHDNQFHLLGLWNRELSETSDLQLQAYYHRSQFEDIVLDEVRHTLDLDFQHRFQLGNRHEIVWGAGYRFTTDDIENTFTNAMNPDSRDLHLFSAFIQDEISLTDEFKLIFGSKFEHNDFTGLEIQPTARFVWVASERNTLWGAVTRAVRTPSRTDNDIRFVLASQPGVNTPDALVLLLGDTGVEAEDSLTYELGYRRKFSDKLAMDIATFFAKGDDQNSFDFGAPFVETTPGPTHEVIPLFFGNNVESESYGVEIVVDWVPMPWWRLQGSYSFYEIDLDPSDTTGDVTPEQSAFLHSFFDLPHNIEVDAILRWVDQLSETGVNDYLTMDVRLGWRPREDLELALVAQNLFDPGRFEWNDQFDRNVRTQIERGVYGKVTWRFK